MKSKKQTAATPKEVPSSRVPLFDKTNLFWMLGGVVLIIKYSTTRIIIAPIVILAGLVVLIFSIFRHPKA
jgi:hypothetical protein